MLKRKNLLEAKLFKKKYENIAKYLNGNSNLEISMNPFRKPYKPSIFNENIFDNKMEVPRNKDLFENIIKEAVNDIIKE